MDQAAKSLIIFSSSSTETAARNKLVNGIIRPAPTPFDADTV